MIVTSSSESSGGTPLRRTQTMYQQRSLQILDGHSGIMELIGDYVGLIRGKELRMLNEFNELVIECTNSYYSRSDDDDKCSSDDDEENSSDDDDDDDDDEDEE